MVPRAEKCSPCGLSVQDYTKTRVWMRKASSKPVCYVLLLKLVTELKRAEREPQSSAVTPVRERNPGDAHSETAMTHLVHIAVKQQY